MFEVTDYSVLDGHDYESWQRIPESGRCQRLFWSDFADELESGTVKAMRAKGNGRAHDAREPEPFFRKSSMFGLCAFRVRDYRYSSTRSRSR